jgi:hypothetical protein
MYKTKLRAWGIRKYNLEQAMAVLAQTIEQRKREGKASNIFKQGKPFAKEKIESHLKKKKKTLEELMKSTAIDAPMPEGFICVTPLPSDGDTPSISEGYMEDSSASQSGSHNRSDTRSNSGSFISLETVTSLPGTVDIPTSLEDMTMFQCERVSQESLLAREQYDESWSHVLDWSQEQQEDQLVDSQMQCELDLMNDVAEEVFRFSTPGSSGSNDLLSMNFHQAMAQPLETFDVPDIQTYYPLHNQSLDSERPEIPSARPERFIALCFLYCILLGRNRRDSANSAFAQAFEIFQTLIVEEHREVLACLNLVLAVLFVHGQNDLAVMLLDQGRKVALEHLEENSSVVISIRFMISQASSTARNWSNNITILRSVHLDSKGDRGPSHPISVTTGYHVAWCLAMDPSTRMEALELLTTLQPVSEKALGELHMQTIAIMNTQARVLFHLCRFLEAEELMAQAMARIQLSGFHDCHPFHLEAKRRHAIFLEAVGKIDGAISNRIQVALGRVRVLGPKHQFSRSSICDAEKALSEGNRSEQLKTFRSQLEKYSWERTMDDQCCDY